MFFLKGRGVVHILLGPNGAGKSNIISFFKMLGYVMSGSLQSQCKHFDEWIKKLQVIK